MAETETAAAPVSDTEAAATPVSPDRDSASTATGRRRLRMSRGVRLGIQLAVSAAMVAYLLWKIDLGETANHIGGSSPLYLAAAVAIWTATLAPMAWRWQVLLASKDIHEPLRWLTKLYFIGYAASQVLPTSIGGDAVRIVEHARRRSDRKGEAAGAVLMERAVGSAGTLVLVAAGLAVAIGRYPEIGFLVRIEFACVAVMVLFGVLVFSQRMNRLLQDRVFPRGHALRLQRPLSAVWTAMHGYRSKGKALGLALAISVFVQFVRIIAIWLCGRAVGLHISPLVYIILGPLLFLVMQIPITINGLGVRESFFVFFLGRFGVGADAAFATGFLFFAVMVAAALPGTLIFAWRSLRGGLTSPRRREAPETTG